MSIQSILLLSFFGEIFGTIGLISSETTFFILMVMQIEAKQNRGALTLKLFVSGNKVKQEFQS